MATINITTLNQNKDTFKSIMDFFDDNRIVHKQADKIKEFPEDVLVLSCTLQRVDSRQRLQSLNMAEKLLELVTDADRQKAEKIREYYKNKLMLLTLKDRDLTKFRKDLQTFIYNHTISIPDSFMGLVYKLPHFYDYDTKVDIVFGGTYSKNTRNKTNAEVVARELKYIDKIEKVRKHLKRMEYWFVDNELNKVMIDFDTHNPLLSLFDRLVTNSTLCINARYHLKLKDFNEYYIVGDKWSFQ